jgi:hypothetical protein
MSTNDQNPLRGCKKFLHKKVFICSYLSVTSLQGLTFSDGGAWLRGPFETFAGREIETSR